MKFENVCIESLAVACPLRERPIAQLMKAYDACGRQAEALRAYTRFREHLLNLCMQRRRCLFHGCIRGAHGPNMTQTNAKNIPGQQCRTEDDNRYDGTQGRPERVSRRHEQITTDATR